MNSYIVSEIISSDLEESQNLRSRYFGAKMQISTILQRIGIPVKINTNLFIWMILLNQITRHPCRLIV